ncbi:helicase-associated domain-containing protein [Subtercola sp. YIM 133946]|uniref:helicase-associated domain-containing protein n=1 Tax=Subtercola sp. YIM 133946 TaxID=3118909 RepID=UPI002F94AEC4
MSDTLALAGRLQRESDDALAALLTARHLAKRDLRDFFDLADALLSTESVQDALSHLDRPTLSALCSADVPLERASPELLAALHSMLVFDADGVLKPYDAVAATLASWPSLGLPDASALADDGPPPTPPPATSDERRLADQLAGERSFETSVAVTELVISLASSPARELAKGGLAVPDAKRLAAATGLTPDDMNGVLSVAERAGLTTRDGSTWFVTPLAHDWLLLPLAERWGVLASAWLAALPAQIVGFLIERVDSSWGDSLVAYLSWLYPAGGSHLAEQTAELVSDAERLGVAANGQASRTGALLLSTGVEAAVEVIAAELPAEVSTVYVQHDLTIVAPGPLRPDLDATLRAIAQIESHSIASTYRISSGSIARALSAGYTAPSIRSFLESISSTGIPQPLEYLIAESSARYGLLRAGTIAPGPGETAGSYVRSDDRELLHTIAVDQRLGSLGLVFVNGNRLVSRFGLDAVYWMLVDARYPVIAESDSGHPQSLTRSQPSTASSAQPTRSVDELINRLRGSGVQGGTDTAEAWLVRQLDAAVKNKTSVLVTVRLPNGSEVALAMVPTSVASGRMRGTDQKAGVERTVPLASITKVVAAVSPVA